MEGILVEQRPHQAYDIVDTRNDQYGCLRLYYDKRAGALPLNTTVSFLIRTSASGYPYAQLISVIQRNATRFHPEDRSKWYTWGEDAEAHFLQHIVPQLQVDLRIHPQKAACPWVMDFYDYTNHRPADLKVQNTPFFTVSKYRYRGRPCDPAYSVTFNRKDYEHYLSHYPDCDIYYWIHWTQREYRTITVPEICGVWRGAFSQMASCIQHRIAPLHPYLHRQDDDHNAKDSFLFDLRDAAVFERLL